MKGEYASGEFPSKFLDSNGDKVYSKKQESSNVFIVVGIIIGLLLLAAGLMFLLGFFEKNGKNIS